LQNYASLGLPLLARVRESAELRNQMAHARMRCLTQWNVRLEELVGQGDEVTWRWREYTLEELERLAHRTTRLSRIVQRASVRIEQEKVLPLLHTLTSP
jgi:hypothetical protein